MIEVKAATAPGLLYEITRALFVAGAFDSLGADCDLWRARGRRLLCPRRLRPQGHAPGAARAPFAPAAEGARRRRGQGAKAPAGGAVRRRRPCSRCCGRRINPGPSAGTSPFDRSPHRTTAVFSGMQPTNTLHLGNYLGALRNWVKLQERCPASTAWWTCTRSPSSHDPKALAQATREVTAAYIAGGVDPEALDPLQPDRRSRRMPSSPGFSIAWRASAGSTA